MNYRELHKPPLEGELNINVPVILDGVEYLQRNPQENPHIAVQAITDEYHGIGFSDLGGRFKIRTPQEQSTFTRKAAELDLRVLAPTFEDDKGRAYYRFLNDVASIDAFMLRASESEVSVFLHQLFSDLRKAHSKGIMYGDRWTPNMLVDSNNELTHIDFDIEISGKPAREFEIAQVIFYTLCAGRDKVLLALAGFLSSNKDWFDRKVVEQFLIGHANFFAKDQVYGDTEGDVESLIAASHTL